MEFIPLSIWIIGFFLVVAYAERTHYQAGWDKADVIKTSDKCAGFCVWGCVFFFALGVLCRI